MAAGGVTTRHGAPRSGRWRGIPGPLLVLLVVLGVVAVVTNFPLILVGLGVWFFFLRGSCGSRSAWGAPAAMVTPCRAGGRPTRFLP